MTFSPPRWISAAILSAALAFAAGPFARGAAELSAPQKEAAAKLQAKGGSVIPVAANSDGWVVNLSTAGKSAGDAELELVKSLPKVEQLDLKIAFAGEHLLSDVHQAEALALTEHRHQLPAP